MKSEGMTCHVAKQSEISSVREKLCVSALLMSCAWNIVCGLGVRVGVWELFFRGGC